MMFVTVLFSGFSAVVPIAFVLEFVCWSVSLCAGTNGRGVKHELVRLREFLFKPVLLDNCEEVSYFFK